MTRVGTRPIAALIAAVLLAALLAACGGSSSDSSSTTSSSTGPDTTAQDGSQGNSSKSSSGQSGSQPQQGNGQDQQSRAQQNDSGGGNSGAVAPLKVSGGGSTQFRTEGGDNSIQEFGNESDESELQEAAQVVHDFYVARTQEEWGKACSYLAKSNIEQLEQLGSQSPQFKNSGCAPILKAFTRPVPASVNREITTVDAGSLRQEGEQGFLIYYGAGHTTYAMPLKSEGDTWKVAALSGSAIG